MSKNFKNHTWITYDEQQNVINHYKLLPLIQEGFSNEDFDNFIIDEESSIVDGGAAMIAYVKLQFTEINKEESIRIINALLRYCELDTLAMVMLWEAWRDWCKD